LKISEISKIRRIFYALNNRNLVRENTPPFQRKYFDKLLVGFYIETNGTKTQLHTIDRKTPTTTQLVGVGECFRDL
tara:strand:- start:255 stop:482 length:228 start_codon:yes stop_codon:yes gene_type:complete